MKALEEFTQDHKNRFKVPEDGVWCVFWDNGKDLFTIIQYSLHYDGMPVDAHGGVLDGCRKLSEEAQRILNNEIKGL